MTKKSLGINMYDHLRNRRFVQLILTTGLWQLVMSLSKHPTCGASNTEKLQYKKQDPSSLTPYLPERLTSSGWSGLSTVGTCALNSLMSFPKPQGFLYNSVTGLCSPLISMVAPSSPGALAAQPTDGDLYLFSREGCTGRFQTMSLSTGELVCLWHVSDIKTTYPAARAICAAMGSYMTSVKTLPKLAILRTLAGGQNTWVGLDDLESEGNFVSASDGEVLTDQQMKDVFGSTEPTGHPGVHCAGFFMDSLKLTYYPCHFEHYFICEKSHTGPTAAKI